MKSWKLTNFAIEFAKAIKSDKCRQRSTTYRKLGFSVALAALVAIFIAIEALWPNGSNDIAEDVSMQVDFQPRQQ